MTFRQPSSPPSLHLVLGADLLLLPQHFPRDEGDGETLRGQRWEWSRSLVIVCATRPTKFPPSQPSAQLIPQQQADTSSHRPHPNNLCLILCRIFCTQANQHSNRFRVPNLALSSHRTTPRHAIHFANHPGERFAQQSTTPLGGCQPMTFVLATKLDRNHGLSGNISAIPAGTAL